MKRFTTLVSGKRSKGDVAVNTDDPPETAAVKALKSFCESGTAGASGEEVLHLPTLVEAAESSPQAAAAAAYQIRKYISHRYNSQSQVQYNAIMLIGILSNNPGQSFTQNVDKKFRDAVKTLLVNSNDPSVQTIMRETLTTLEREKSYDPNLAPLIEMWRASKSEMQQSTTNYNTFANQQAQLLARSGGQQRSRVSNKLPPPAELSGRVEEARTTAKLLIQLAQSTPPGEIASSGLAKEFADRCQSALQNLHGYMNCTDPSPDEQTFQTLIETCEQLNVASSKYQRALLAARRMVSGTPPQAAPLATPPPPRAAAGQYAPPTQPPPPPPNGVDSQQHQAPPTAEFLQTQTHPSAAAVHPANRQQADPFGDEYRIQRDGSLVRNGVSAAQQPPEASTNSSSATDAAHWQEARSVEPADRSPHTRAQPPPITTDTTAHRTSAASYDDDLYGMSAPAEQQRSSQHPFNALSAAQTPQHMYAAPDRSAYATPQRPVQGQGSQWDYSYPTPASSDFPYPSPIGAVGGGAGVGNGARRVKDDDPMP